MTSDDFAFVPLPLVWRRVMRMVYERFSLFGKPYPANRHEFLPVNALIYYSNLIRPYQNAVMPHSLMPSQVAALTAGIAGNRQIIQPVSEGTLAVPADFEVLDVDFALAIAARYNEMYYVYFDTVAELMWNDYKTVESGYVVPSDYAETVRASEGSSHSGGVTFSQYYSSGAIGVRLCDLFSPRFDRAPSYCGDVAGDYTFIVFGEATGVTSNGVTVYNDAVPPPDVAGVAPGGAVSYLGPTITYEGVPVSLTLYSDMRQSPSRMSFTIDYMFRSFFNEFSFLESVNDLSTEW